MWNLIERIDVHIVVLESWVCWFVVQFVCYCAYSVFFLFYNALSDSWASGRQPDGHDNRGQKNCPDFWDEGGYWPLSNR